MWHWTTADRTVWSSWKVLKMVNLVNHLSALVVSFGLVILLASPANCSKCFPGREWECDNGKCIQAIWLCDGENDCGDSSDEGEGCPPTTPTFQPTTVKPTTVKPTGSKCFPGREWECDNGKLCIHATWLCDGENDCSDSSDEEGCSPTTPTFQPTTVKPTDSHCGNDEFECQNGRCISYNWRCDKDNDCGDLSDEQGCWTSQTFPPTTTVKPTGSHCANDQFECRNGGCIHGAWRCDGDNDCRDSSDEEGCWSTQTFPPTTTVKPTGSQCANDQFECTNGRCINHNWQCDNDNDCGDSSDEEGCWTLQTTTVQPTESQCANDQFQCKDGGCLHGTWRCDGDIDCGDSSDEEGCTPSTPTFPPTTVKPTSSHSTNVEFECKNSRYIPDQWRCDGENDCGDSSDETGCWTTNTFPPTTTKSIGSHCSNDEFECKNGKCINSSWRCDGDNDCGDSSDETGCWTTTTFPPTTTKSIGSHCANDESKCKNGKCINSSWRCDGDNDCGDSSDETGCWTTPTFPPTTPKPTGSHCSNDEFECKNGKCINSSWRCDGDNDCGDSSDETGCWTTTTFPPTTPTQTGSHCANDEFECKNGKCINSSWRCDQDNDCGDSSDETVCWTTPTFPPTTPKPTDTRVNCPDFQFACADGTQCIHTNWQCDMENDCNDDSDELNCPTIECNSTEHMCPSYNCIPKWWLCDGDNDCGDSSDEVGCGETTPTAAAVIPTPEPTVPKIQCGEEEFMCHETRQCIHTSLLCDSKRDCDDWSDEKDCAAKCALRFQFKCSDGSCTVRSLVCDGVDDCADGSDEDLSMCGSWKCRSDEFTCGNGTCIPIELQCNRVVDCEDQSDEVDCVGKCAVDEVKCTNDSHCIRQAWLCDNTKDCQDGSDEVDCPTMPPVNCSADQFKCSENKCIPKAWLCDGHYHCANGEDENTCAPQTCSIYEYRCADEHECIHQFFVCDNETTCRDSSDEVNCSATCGLDQYTCFDKTCISKSSLCDGHNDCANGEDETTCNPKTCARDEFRCADKHECIYQPHVCDNDTDCGDGSDEVNCTVKCRINEFSCSDKTCISTASLCDIKFDCVNGEDESACDKKTCTADEYTCSDKTCIAKRWLCDGDIDCPSGEDENSCGPQTCAANQFKCANDSRCIHQSWICDNENDCNDGSDEVNCTVNCGADEYRCSDGKCISKASLCDGDFDCRRGEDDSACDPNPQTCNVNEFTCGNSSCVPNEWKCDGTPQCGDESDEKDCDHTFCSVDGGEATQGCGGRVDMCKAYFEPVTSNSIFTCGSCNASDLCCVEKPAAGNGEVAPITRADYDQVECLNCLIGNGTKTGTCSKGLSRGSAEKNSVACVVEWDDQSKGNVYSCQNKTYCKTRGHCCRSCSTDSCNNRNIACGHKYGAFLKKPFQKSKGPNSR